MPITLYMRPKGTTSELEARRRRAVALLVEEGLGVRDVARRVGVRHSSVERWRDAFLRDRKDGLAAKPHSGSKPRLADKDRQRLVRYLLQGPRAHGYPTDLWTLRRVAELIEDCFGVHYHPCSVWHVLHGLGWSAQKPELRARERDEKATERWRGARWAHIKKRAPNGPEHRDS